MIAINRKEDCCGCTACASACPVKCIVMQEDEEGFKYPSVNTDKCIQCGKCEQVCPVLNKPVEKEKPAAYLARTKDNELLKECTSGGVFTQIAKSVVQQGGTAYGAVFDENFTVCHQRISSLDDMSKLPGSKYVQSEMGDIFLRVKDDVLSGKNVVFCGTPCQVAGLKNYLGKDYDNLLIVDLVCHGVPSPKLWKDYVDYLRKEKGEIQYINFRSKYLGYHVSVMEERFTNGKRQIGSARTNLMSKCFFRNAADRPICYECPFKTVSRCSDLTLFDGWHAGEYIPHLKDDDRGYTVVLVQSKKGASFLASLNCFVLYNINTERAVSLDGKMAVNSVARPDCRDSFYELLDDKGIEKTVQTFFPISMSDFAIETSKLFLDKLGILQKIKKMKR